MTTGYIVNSNNVVQHYVSKYITRCTLYSMYNIYSEECKTVKSVVCTLYINCCTVRFQKKLVFLLLYVPKKCITMEKQRKFIIFDIFLNSDDNFFV